MIPNYNDRYVDNFIQALYPTDQFIKKLADQKSQWLEEGKTQAQWEEFASKQIKDSLKE
jgi:hypothetical protein